MIFILKLKKPDIHVLSEVMKEKQSIRSVLLERQSIRIVLLFQNATIFMLFIPSKAILRLYAINLSSFGLCNL